MSGLTVVNFKKPEEPKAVPRLPTEEEVKWMLGDRPLMHAVVILVNEDYEQSRWIANLNNYEAIGLMEQTKLDILVGAGDDLDD